MSLLDANMVAFQTSAYMLLTMGVMILAGNTCYPVFLRLIIWTILKFLPKTERWKEDRSTLEFLLLHPRRCYTNLFPSRHTWWLLGSVVCLNGIDWIGFEILNVRLPAVISCTRVADLKNRSGTRLSRMSLGDLRFLTDSFKHWPSVVEGSMSYLSLQSVCHCKSSTLS